MKRLKCQIHTVPLKSLSDPSMNEISMFIILKTNYFKCGFSTKVNAFLLQEKMIVDQFSRVQHFESGTAIFHGW